MKCKISHVIFRQQADISRCVVKKDLAPEHHWLSSSVESLKYFLTTIYVYIWKEAWTSARIKKKCIGGILLIIITGRMSVKNLIMETVCCWMAISKCFISIAFESVVAL